ncbi:MAG: alpha/beta fold hydrolase [Gammaproteobacteria bacterium]|nr:alpha/beta fold hydrolase [Gammaproteobacteria bacterium]
MKNTYAENCLYDNIDTELIGIIYEVALDPHLWPDLLDVLGSTINHSDAANLSAHIHTAENDRLFRLRPHIHRAQAINRRLSNTKQENQLSNAIIDQLPVGIVIINAEREVISANKCANKIIHRQPEISIINNKFLIDDPQKNERLTGYIRHLTEKEHKKDNTYSLSVHQQDQAALSLLVMNNSYCHQHYDNSANCRVILFIASPINQYSISHDALQSLFQLSPAETRLTASLASGISINQFSLTNHITKHTARTQLKNIFQKTGTHKQTELIKLVLTSPAMLIPSHAEQPYSQKPDHTLQTSQYTFDEKRLILIDGRQLSFCEYGDPNGVPLFFFHGILGSRYERHPDDSIIKRLGIRLIIPDRPGYGYSDANHSGDYLDFAEDIAQLADYLNIHVFSIFGLSIGAIYAAACAYKFPGKIKNATLLGTTLPFLSFSDMDGLPSSFKFQYVSGRYMPALVSIFPEMAIKNAHSNPAKFFKNIPMSDQDREIFFQEEFHQHFVNSLLAGGEISHDGFIKDIKTSTQALPFFFDDIKIKLDFWHGTDDLHSPIRRIQMLAEDVDNATITPVQGEGHFFIYKHWGDILESIINTAR